MTLPESDRLGALRAAVTSVRLDNVPVCVEHLNIAAAIPRARRSPVLSVLTLFNSSLLDGYRALHFCMKRTEIRKRTLLGEGVPPGSSGVD